MRFLVIFITLYGAETWTVKKRERDILNAFVVETDHVYSMDARLYPQRIGSFRKTTTSGKIILCQEEFRKSTEACGHRNAGGKASEKTVSYKMVRLNKGIDGIIPEHSEQTQNKKNVQMYSARFGLKFVYINKNCTCYWRQNIDFKNKKH